MVDTLYKKPQYFNLIDSEGKIQGKILARFFLLKRDQTGNEEAKKSEIFNYMMRITEEIHQVDIKVSILGIKNLLNATN
jgi:hypothetical protein